MARNPHPPRIRGGDGSWKTRPATLTRSRQPLPAPWRPPVGPRRPRARIPAGADPPDPDPLISSPPHPLPQPPPKAAACGAESPGRSFPLWPHFRSGPEGWGGGEMGGTWRRGRPRPSTALPASSPAHFRPVGRWGPREPGRKARGPGAVVFRGRRRTGADRTVALRCPSWGRTYPVQASSALETSGNWALERGVGLVLADWLYTSAWKLGKWIFIS